jgi:hypothetical protein
MAQALGWTLVPPAAEGLLPHALYHIFPGSPIDGEPGLDGRVGFPRPAAVID